MSAGWLPAQMLQAGMTLVNRDNEQTLKIVSQTKLDKTDTVYNFEVDEFHTYHIGEFGVWVHNADCLGTFVRSGSNQIRIIGGNSKRGMQHILERHSADKYLSHPKGDLFPVGTTEKQIIDAIGIVYARGTRVSNPNKTVQTFEKRLRINGEVANYRLIIDTNINDVVTFFKIGQ